MKNYRDCRRVKSEMKTKAIFKFEEGLKRQLIQVLKANQARRVVKAEKWKLAESKSKEIERKQMRACFEALRMIDTELDEAFTKVRQQRILSLVKSAL